MTSFAGYLNDLSQGLVLSEQGMNDAITLMMDGAADAAQMTQFLTMLSDRGETAAEIAGAARAMRDKAATIAAPDGAIDCCGTGGDGTGTYNISTAVALVAAACGVPVAKHGNRAASSKSGAADVLEQLGVNLDAPREKLERALRETNFCFLMAPNHHAAMKHVAPVRRTLGRRTIFNLLGPLANPAGTKKQLIGVYDRKWVIPMAEALKSLGTHTALVVHGADGLDEITLTGETYAAHLGPDGMIQNLVFTPETFGLAEINAADIKGGDAATNAAALDALLRGEISAYRAMVCANAAAALFLHDARPFTQGAKDAAQALDSGAALSVLTRYKELTA